MKYRFKSVNFLFVLTLSAGFFTFLGIVGAECRLFISAPTTAVEGNTGTTLATFILTKEGEAGCVASAKISTSDGTAIGGSCSGGADFDRLSSEGIRLEANESSKNISITVCGDSTDEVDETFSVTLQPDNGETVVDDGEGQATIIDDDPPPNLRIGDVTINEGNAGQANATLNVTLSSASGKTVTVLFATAGNTATSGGSCGGNTDFLAANNTLTINANSLSGSVRVAVCGDSLFEANENFRVDLSNSTNATIQDSQGQGTITNDDLAGFTINNVVVNEGTAGTSTVNFTINLPVANPVGASVICAAGVAPLTLNGPKPATEGTSCILGVDFIRTRGTRIVFGPTDTAKFCQVTVCGDTKDETDEAFLVNLSGPQGAVISDATGVGTIRDND